jgi:hypothetical protein
MEELFSGSTALIEEPGFYGKWSRTKTNPVIYFSLQILGAEPMNR